MAEKFTSRLRGEQGICMANLIISLTLLIISGTKSFLEGEPTTGWLLFGCGLLLAAAYFLIGKLKGGITPKALLSALCQPPLILYLMGSGEFLYLTYFLLSADLVLTGAYFCLWISLPQFLFSDLMVLLHILWDMSGNSSLFAVPFILFQLIGLATIFSVWRGNFYRKQFHILSEEFDGLLDMFGDLYNHLQQGFDRTLVRLEQISEQDGLLLECSSCLGAASEPVFSGVQRSVQILEKLLLIWKNVWLFFLIHSFGKHADSFNRHRQHWSKIKGWLPRFWGLSTIIRGMSAQYSRIHVP